MAYYTVCPCCGANLDPGEKCDCMDARAGMEEFFRDHMETETDSGQLAFVFSKEEEGKQGCGI